VWLVVWVIERRVRPASREAGIRASWQSSAELVSDQPGTVGDHGHR
jgi:hypothetical protein